MSSSKCYIKLLYMKSRDLNVPIHYCPEVLKADFIDRTVHLSNPSSISPPKTDNQIPSSPASDSPHYAPRTSTCQIPDASPAAADSSRYPPPSMLGSHPRRPSTGTAARRGLEKCASHFAAPASRSAGMWRLGSAGRSR